MFVLLPVIIALLTYLPIRDTHPYRASTGDFFTRFWNRGCRVFRLAPSFILQLDTSSQTYPGRCPTTCPYSLLELAASHDW